MSKTPPKRHVRVFRIAPGRWAYLVTGSEPYLPLQSETRTWVSALRRGTWWLRMSEMREAPGCGGWSAP